MGARIELQNGYVQARSSRLKGADFTFDLNTVTGTENMIMAASLAKGTTVLRNCAMEPEIKELAKVINRMGGSIDGAGTPTIVIEGRDKLDGIVHEIMSDRIEVGTYLLAGAITHGDVTVESCRPSDIMSLLQKLDEAGLDVIVEEDSVRVASKGALKSRDVETEPYPGFATDFQAQYMALMSLADSSSRVTEKVFENRFMHVQELVRMGACIRVSGRTATIDGVKRLSGAHVQATDLRASACLVLAGLAAEGRTEVHRVYHLDRGYEKIEDKLNALGASVRREKDAML